LIKRLIVQKKTVKKSDSSSFQQQMEELGADTKMESKGEI